MHAISHERQGASFYVPDLSNNAVTCRYEMPCKVKYQKLGIRLGFIIYIATDDLREISAYATTNEVIEDNLLPLPSFTQASLDKLLQECIQLLNDALQRLDPKMHKERRIVFYLEMRGQMAIKTEFQTEDKKFLIFPSALIEGTMVSPVCITVNAASNQSAKPLALHEVIVFCALQTLANGFLFQTKELKWSHKKPRVEFIDSLEQFDIKNLYPSCKQPQVQYDDNISSRSNLAWNLYQKLQNKNQDIFLTALFAYYSAQNINYKYSTMAIVAYCAVLNLLAKSNKQKCPGQVNCSCCGTLTFKHDMVGDMAAINIFLKEILKPSPEQENDLRQLVKRIYRKQRSAFVHGAELRHEEFHNNYSLPKTFPTSNKPVRDIFHYQSDFLSLERITRRVLLEWLCQINGEILDKKLFNLDELGINIVFLGEASINLPKNTWVKLFHDGHRDTQGDFND
jgi:hypothetical protein